MKFRKKPVVIEATQWNKDGDHPNVVSLPSKVGETMEERAMGWDPMQYRWIGTLEGGHIVSPGDWIITGVQAEQYPCKPDIFAATYEPVDAAAGASPQPADVIDDAVNKFLGWKLPRDFSPDCLISFNADSDYFKQYPQEWPIGTNLLTAYQARSMFEHCLAGASLVQPADLNVKVNLCEQCGKVLPNTGTHGHSCDAVYRPVQPSQAPCKGTNCGSTDGVNHSAECHAEHDAAANCGTLDTPGNRHPEHRYAGYKGQAIAAGATDDQVAAYQSGVAAKVQPSQAGS